MSPVLRAPIESRLASVGLTLEEVHTYLMPGEYIDSFEVNVSRSLLDYRTCFSARLEWRSGANGHGYAEAEQWSQRHLGTTLRRMLALRKGPAAPSSKKVGPA